MPPVVAPQAARGRRVVEVQDRGEKGSGPQIPLAVWESDGRGGRAPYARAGTESPAWCIVRFAKVFSSLWQGSMVGKPDAQLVFVYMLANCERDGTIDCTPEVIAALTGLQVDRVRSAIVYLESEDNRSRTPDESGRRIVRLDSHRDWGWKIVNYQAYRSFRDIDKRKEDARERMRKARNDKRELGNVSSVRQCSPVFAQAVESSLPLATLGEGTRFAREETSVSFLTESSLDSVKHSARGSDGNGAKAPAARDGGANPTPLGAILSELAPRLGLQNALCAPETARAAQNAAGMAPESDPAKKRDPGRNTAQREHVELVHEMVKREVSADVFGRTVVIALAITNRLYNRGIRSPTVLVGIARYWLERRAAIRNPWAYFSPGSQGFEALRMMVSAQASVDEHRALEAATRDWLEVAPRKGRS